MSIVTLTSDWGLNDYYVAAVKGKLLSFIPSLNIVDISHNINPLDKEEASYVLKYAFPYFPEGSIHIISIDSIASPETPHILVKFKNHFFICADNGIISLIIGNEKPDFIIDIDFPQDSDVYNFPTKDLFVKVAIHIIQQKNVDELGQYKEEFKFPLINSEPVSEINLIIGKVIHIDNFSNVVTNVSRQLFKSVQKGRKFKIIVIPGFALYQIKESYMDVEQNTMVAIFNDNDLLEIAINRGQLASLLSINKIDSQIRIEFED